MVLHRFNADLTVAPHPMPVRCDAAKKVQSSLCLDRAGVKTTLPHMGTRRNDSVTGSTPVHRAFIVRCWAEPGAGTAASSIWRYSVQEMPDGPRLGFACLDELLGYLREEADHRSEP